MVQDNCKPIIKNLTPKIDYVFSIFKASVYGTAKIGQYTLYIYYKGIPPVFTHWKNKKTVHLSFIPNT
jgi:hypothetical protein